MVRLETLFRALLDAPDRGISLQEQVELKLGYSEGSLNKWHNALSTTIREFFRGV